MSGRCSAPGTNFLTDARSTDVILLSHPSKPLSYMSVCVCEAFTKLSQGLHQFATKDERRESQSAGRTVTNDFMIGRSVHLIFDPF